MRYDNISDEDVRRLMAGVIHSDIKVISAKNGNFVASYGICLFLCGVFFCLDFGLWLYAVTSPGLFVLLAAAATLGVCAFFFHVSRSIYKHQTGLVNKAENDIMRLVCELEMHANARSKKQRGKRETQQ